MTFAPAKVTFDISERKIEVLVKHAAGSDRFLLDPQFPFLLREWTAADDSHLKMKNSLRVDYRNTTRTEIASAPSKIRCCAIRINIDGACISMRIFYWGAIVFCHVESRSRGKTSLIVSERSEKDE